MDPLSLSRQVGEIAAEPGPRTERAQRISETICVAGGYRWVGIYDVLPEEIAVIGWSGPSAPAYPHFPRTQGLCGAAVASGQTVVVNDVSRDSRYLTTLATTKAEMIVLVRMASDARIVGLVDIESERIDAFSGADRAMIESCAGSLVSLWKPESAST